PPERRRSATIQPPVGTGRNAETRSWPGGGAPSRRKLGGFDHAARDFAPPCPLHALLGKGARGAYRSISHREDPDLGARTRKFIGLIGILAFLAAYVAVATSIA